MSAGGQRKFGRGTRTPSRKSYAAENRLGKRKKRNILLHNTTRNPRSERRVHLQPTEAVEDV